MDDGKTWIELKHVRTGWVGLGVVEIEALSNVLSERDVRSELVGGVLTPLFHRHGLPK